MGGRDLHHCVSPSSVKSHFKVLGLHDFIRGLGWAYKREGFIYPGGLYISGIKNVSERRDKTYLRKELTLTYHYILSQPGGLYPGGFIIIYMCSLANGWAYIRGGLKPGEGFIVGFYDIMSGINLVPRGQSPPQGNC